MSSRKPMKKGAKRAGAKTPVNDDRASLPPVEPPKPQHPTTSLCITLTARPHPDLLTPILDASSIAPTQPPPRAASPGPNSRVASPGPKGKQASGGNSTKNQESDKPQQETGPRFPFPFQGCYFSYELPQDSTTPVPTQQPTQVPTRGGAQAANAAVSQTDPPPRAPGLSQAADHWPMRKTTRTNPLYAPTLPIAPSDEISQETNENGDGLDASVVRPSSPPFWTHSETHTVELTETFLASLTQSIAVHCWAPHPYTPRTQTGGGEVLNGNARSISPLPQSPAVGTPKSRAPSPAGKGLPTRNRRRATAPPADDTTTHTQTDAHPPTPTHTNEHGDALHGIAYLDLLPLVFDAPKVEWRLSDEILRCDQVKQIELVPHARGEESVSSLNPLEPRPLDPSLLTSHEAALRHLAAVFAELTVCVRVAAPPVMPQDRPITPAPLTPSQPQPTAQPLLSPISHTGSVATPTSISQAGQAPLETTASGMGQGQGQGVFPPVRPLTLLPRELKEQLNPMVITLHSAERLPTNPSLPLLESHCHPVFAALPCLEIQPPVQAQAQTSGTECEKEAPAVSAMASPRRGKKSAHAASSPDTHTPKAPSPAPTARTEVNHASESTQGETPQDNEKETPRHTLLVHRTTTNPVPRLPTPLPTKPHTHTSTSTSTHPNTRASTRGQAMLAHTLTRNLNKKDSALFNHRQMVFVGKLDVGEFAAWLADVPFCVEIYDRHRIQAQYPPSPPPALKLYTPPNSQPIAPDNQTDNQLTIDDQKRSRGNGGTKQCGEVPQEAPKLQGADPCGLAIFSFHEIAQGGLTHYTLRAPISPMLQPPRCLLEGVEDATMMIDSLTQTPTQTAQGANPPTQTLNPSESETPAQRIEKQTSQGTKKRGAVSQSEEPSLQEPSSSSEGKGKKKKQNAPQEKPSVVPSPPLPSGCYAESNSTAKLSVQLSVPLPRTALQLGPFARAIISCNGPVAPLQVRKLLELVWTRNVATLNLSGPIPSVLTNAVLTDVQHQDPHLDIITGLQLFNGHPSDTVNKRSGSPRRNCTLTALGNATAMTRGGGAQSLLGNTVMSNGTQALAQTQTQAQAAQSGNSKADSLAGARMFILEGLREHGMQAILDLLNSPLFTSAHVITDPHSTFRARLYSHLGLDLERFRVRRPLHILSKLTEVAIRGRATIECIECIRRLAQIPSITKFRHLTEMHLWPSVEMLHALEKRFGDSLDDSDISLPPIPDESAFLNSTTHTAPHNTHTHQPVDDDTTSYLNESQAAAFWAQEMQARLQEIEPRVEHTNPEFEMYLAQREKEPCKDYEGIYRDHVMKMSGEVKRSRAKVRLMGGGPATMTTRQPTGEVYIYGGQKLNTAAVLQEELRQKITHDKRHHYTFSEEYMSASIPKGDLQALHREERELSETKMLTKGGFRYPHPPAPHERHTHPHRPTDYRIAELAEPWEEPRNPNVRPEGDSAPRVVKARNTAGKKKEYEGTYDQNAAYQRELIEKEREEWRSKVVVDDPVFRVSAGRSAHPMDRNKTLLRDSPKRPSLAKKPLNAEPLSIFSSEEFVDAGRRADPLQRSAAIHDASRPAFRSQHHDTLLYRPTATRPSIKPLTQADKQRSAHLFRSQ